MKKIIYAFFLIYSLGTLNSAGIAQQENDEIQVQEALTRFLVAYNYLDWEEFQNSFTENATIFGSRWVYAGRNDLQNSMFFELFSRRDEVPGEPPYLNLTPLDLEIEVFGNTALVTFNLSTGDSETLAQRSLFYIIENGVWKIHHVHASEVGDSGAG